jgi:O-antigen polysaccharide polymerase Wzy
LFKYLILSNAIAWFAPAFASKGLLRSYLLVVAFLFSGSNWTAFIFYGYKESTLDGVIFNYLELGLYFSLLAAVSFYMGFYLIIKKEVLNNLSKFIYISQIKNLSWKLGVFWCRLTLMALLPLTFLLALQDVAVGDRVYFLDVVNPFWYRVLLPLNSLLLFFLIFFDSNSIIYNTIRKDFLLWLFLIAHVFLVGFDGSRRDALLPLMAILLKVVIYNINNGDKFLGLNAKTILALMVVLLITFLTLSRAYDVGWGIFKQDLVEILGYTPVFFELIISASPTQHSTTQMLELIDIEGSHGPNYYFRALGNLLFPKFIFGQYFFGEPLVNVLHERFGWYGQDFGFLAEAIYAGGWVGVILMHLLYGIFVAKVINGYISKKYSTFFKILSLTIIFGLANSLRSDFMNILKATFYPAIAIYIVFIILTRLKKNNKRLKENTLCAE